MQSLFEKCELRSTWEASLIQSSVSLFISLRLFFFLVGTDYFRLHLSNIQYIKQSNKQTDAQPNQNTFFSNI